MKKAKRYRLEIIYGWVKVFALILNMGTARKILQRLSLPLPEDTCTVSLGPLKLKFIHLGLADESRP